MGSSTAASVLSTNSQHQHATNPHLPQYLPNSDLPGCEPVHKYDRCPAKWQTLCQMQPVPGSRSRLLSVLLPFTGRKRGNKTEKLEESKWGEKTESRKIQAEALAIA